MSHRTRRNALRALLALCVVGLVAGAAAQAAKKGNKAHRRVFAHASAAAGAGGYSILSRAPTATDEENAQVVQARGHYPGLVPAEARVLSSSPEGRVWLMPTDNGELCLGIEPGSQYLQREKERGLGHLTMGFTCSSAGKAQQEGMLTRIYENVVGIVPDGVSKVSYVAGDAAAQTQETKQNTYSFFVHEGFVQGTVSFTGASGEEVADRF
jgi:hypothetical protein